MYFEPNWVLLSSHVEPLSVQLTEFHACCETTVIKISLKHNTEHLSDVPRPATEESVQTAESLPLLLCPFVLA